MAAVITVMLASWLHHVIPAMSEHHAPQNLSLPSVNLVHQLTWEPGMHSSDAHYTVQVRAWSGRWAVVAGCERVTHPLQCVLTEALSDPQQKYYIQVVAKRGNQSWKSDTLSFIPLLNSTLDLPRLSVEPCDGTLCVHLKPPLERLRAVYSRFKHTLRIQSTQPPGTQFMEVPFGTHRLENLAPGREYCFSVRFLIIDFDIPSNYSLARCATTTPVYIQDGTIAAVLCSVMFLVLPGVYLCIRAGFCCLTWSLPDILVSIRHHEERFLLQLCDGPMSRITHAGQTAPSGGENKNSADSEDESEASDVESSGVSSGRGYELRGGAHLCLSSTSGSACTSGSVPPLPPPMAPSLHSESALLLVPTTGGLASPPSGLIDAQPCDGLSRHPAAPSPGAPPQTEALFPEGTDEPESTAGEGRQEVNLMSVIIPGWMLKESPDSADATEEDAPLILTNEQAEVAMGTLSEDEEEEEDFSGYMGR